MKLQESGENYLETILLLEERLGAVRSVDVANELGFTKASISRAMKILGDSGLITVGSGGSILLTEQGREQARGIYERHRVITEYFVKTLGVERAAAERDACRIEHILSSEIFERIKELVGPPPPKA